MSDITIQLSPEEIMAVVLAIITFILAIILIVVFKLIRPYSPLDPHHVPYRNFGIFDMLFLIGGILFLLYYFRGCNSNLLNEFGSNIKFEEPITTGSMLADYDDSPSISEKQDQAISHKRINVSPSEKELPEDVDIFGIYDKKPVKTVEKAKQLVHYVQVSPARDIDSGKAEVHKLNAHFPGMVSLARSDLPSDQKFPFKILIGPFEDESDARAFAKKKRGRFYRNINEDQLTIIQES